MENDFLGRSSRIFREQRNIWKGSPIFPGGIFQTEIRVSVFHVSKHSQEYQFQAFAVVFLVQMVNAIPGLTLPVKNFAHVNSKQPTVFIRISTQPRISAHLEEAPNPFPLPPTPPPTPQK